MSSDATKPAGSSADRQKEKYVFTHIPAKALPTGLFSFLVYVFRYNPGTWLLFVAQDIVHYARMPLFFVLTGVIIDRLGGLGTPAIPPDIWQLVALTAFILFFGELAHVWTARIIVKWHARLRAKIRSDFFYYTIGHSQAYLNDQFAGALARKITEVAESMLRLHDNFRFFLLAAGIQIVTTMIAVLTIAPHYALILLAFTAAITLPIFFRAKSISARTERYSDTRAEVTGKVVDTITNSAAVKSFARRMYEYGTHEKASAKEIRAFAKMVRALVQIDEFRRLSIVAVMTGMVSLALLDWAAGRISLGDIATIAGFSFTMIGAAWTLGRGIIQVYNEAGYVTDALRITAKPHDVTDAEAAAELKVPKGEIRYDHVHFRFPGVEVFKDLDLTIPPGQKIALIGRSGAGKSTFVHLLQRFYDLQEGRILIDGQDIASVTQRSLREQVAVIPQDTPLFHRSLMENIRYGRLEASEEEVIEAARRAHAHEFIETLPERYETLVGERGIKLSGGQRQRIAIARAILKNAPILVLDEATSALDSESEKLIQESLNDLMRGKTVVAIAHRLSTIAHMDRILVFEKGEIVEDGTHEALLKQGGLYTKLWTMQSGGFIRV